MKVSRKQERILCFLRSRPGNQAARKDILEHLATSISDRESVGRNLTATLSRMRERGLVDRPSKGIYRACVKPAPHPTPDTLCDDMMLDVKTNTQNKSRGNAVLGSLVSRCVVLQAPQGNPHEAVVFSFGPSIRLALHCHSGKGNRVGLALNGKRHASDSALLGALATIICGESPLQPIEASETALHLLNVVYHALSVGVKCLDPRRTRWISNGNR